MFFRLNSWALGLILFAIVFGATALGSVLGRRARHMSDVLKEPFGVLQAALLGVVGLILAFGLALAVGRYENRRQAVVDDANAIGTTFLRAQTLAEPERTASLDLLKRYTDADITGSDAVPGSAEASAAIALESGPKTAVATRRAVARCLPERERTSTLCRVPQRDDRHARRPGGGCSTTVSPAPSCSSRLPGRQRPSDFSPPTSASLAVGSSPCCSAQRSSRCCCS